MKQIMSIDPGNIHSAYVIWDGKRILDFNKIENEELIKKLEEFCNFSFDFAIEKIASYGMISGASIYDTCEIVGRIQQKLIDSQKGYSANIHKVFRREVKLHICGSLKAKDANIIQALKDRFEPDLQPKQRPKGVLKGLKSDCWQAFALAVYYYDNFIAKK